MKTASRKLSTFPAFFSVEGKTIAVFGNDEEAFAKLRLLSNTNAHLISYADAPSDALVNYAKDNNIKIIRQTFNPNQLDGKTLIFAGTADKDLDQQIVTQARSRSIPANAVDQPDFCDFYTPALVNRAPVAVAIGTEGAGPVLAQQIRARIDQMLSPSIGPLAQLAAQYRNSVDQILPRGITRRLFWRRFFTGDIARHVAQGNMSIARRAVTRILQNNEQEKGHVWLVGAGPGSEDLLTLRAQRVMMECDVILYDALVPEAVVNMARRDAERIFVGKLKGEHSKGQDEINQLMVNFALEGKRVVRLKSGDPLIYGRAAEEMAALEQANISYEIVPGISSAMAAAADFKLPLTLRGKASSLVFTTAHDLQGDALPDWVNLAISGATLAVYMGKSVAGETSDRLIKAGMEYTTPVAIVENAGREDTRLFHTTLSGLKSLNENETLSGPVMVIIGQAVASASLEKSSPITKPIIDSNKLELSAI